VVVCEPYPVLYGAQRSLLDLYRVWQCQGRYRVHFVYFTDGPMAEAVRELGIPSTRLPVGRRVGSYHRRILGLRRAQLPLVALELLSLGRALARCLVEQRASLLHSNNERAGLMSALGARWVRCPMVTHLRGDGSLRRLQRLAYWVSPEVVWVSSRVRDDFARHYGMRRVRGPVIHNGRNLMNGDDCVASSPWTELGLPADAVVALTVASLEVRKGHEHLIEAARVACAADPRLYFVLAGADLSLGQERGQLLRRLIEAAGLSSRVILLGHRTDVDRLMRAAHVLVHSARSEALSGALIEALGHGLPCIATDTGGTAEIVQHGVTGLLVPPGDTLALARALRELVHDPERRHRLGCNARARFLQDFTIEQCAERTGACFDEIIRQR
jgi:glycosyltransferase involved in cell wall biosynthesis